MLYYSICCYIYLDTFASLYKPLINDEFTKYNTYANILLNVRLSMMFSILPSSLQTYSSGWSQWTKYTELFSIDKFLRFPPSDWPTTSPYPFQPAAVSAFITYIYFQSELLPTTTTSYVTGIKFFMTAEGFMTDFLQSRIVSSAKSAILIHYRSKHPVSERERFPFIQYNTLLLPV